MKERSGRRLPEIERCGEIAGVRPSARQRIEAEAQDYLRNAIRIITETGLRVYTYATRL